MLKRILAAFMAVLCAGTLAAALTITGTNSEWKNSVFWVGIPRVSRDENVTATPSGTITTSYQITAGITYVLTVATGGDSVKLPITTGPSAGANAVGGGFEMVVINGSANALNIFPFQAADTINALGAGSALSLAAGKVTTCYVAVDGKWFCNLSA